MPRDLRLVLVITGKGRADDGRASVRTATASCATACRTGWPRRRSAGRILQVAPAHQRHGGAGAFYVYLRRRR